MDGPLSPALCDQVLERLGFSTPPAPDLAGPRLVYERWCAGVPFDNVRKMVAVRQPGTSPLPGIAAADFLATWLADGTGGTCWTGANALCAFLEAIGFEARLVGSMGDRGVVTHGTVKVSLDGVDWLVDSFMQTFARGARQRGAIQQADR